MENKLIVQRLNEVNGALSMVRTNGESTLIMADCIRSIQTFQQELLNEVEASNDRKEKANEN